MNRKPDRHQTLKPLSRSIIGVAVSWLVLIIALFTVVFWYLEHRREPNEMSSIVRVASDSMSQRLRPLLEENNIGALKDQLAWVHESKLIRHAAVYSGEGHELASTHPGLSSEIEPLLQRYNSDRRHPSGNSVLFAGPTREGPPVYFEPLYGSNPAAAELAPAAAGEQYRSAAPIAFLAVWPDTSQIRAGYSPALIRTAVAVAIIAVISSVVFVAGLFGKLIRPVTTLTQAVRDYDVEGISTAARLTRSVELHAMIASLVALLSELEARSTDINRVVQLRINDLNSTIDEIKRAQVKLLHEEKLASIGRLSSGIAHEINNPAGYVTGNLETLSEYIEKLESRFRFLESQLPEESFDSTADEETVLERIREFDEENGIPHIRSDITKLLAASGEGMHRIKSIVRDLGAFIGSREDVPQIQDLKQCITDTVNVVRHQVRQSHSLVVDLHEQVRARIPKQQLKHVLMNVILNATDALPQPGTVTIRLRRHGQYAVISIADDGEGIPAANRGLIFEPFFSSKPVGQGTGLGLYVSHKLIEEAGGSITVSSAPGEGTVVCIYLPLVHSFEPAAGNSYLEGIVGRSQTAV